MLVTFHTKAYADITLFGDVALTLLKAIGHSGTVPSAIVADDVPAALARLKTVAASPTSSASEARNGDDEPSVSLSNRALPLIKLFEAAIAAHADVMWD